MEFSCLRKGDLLVPDDLGQLWGHVELHLEKYQEISCGLAGDSTTYLETILLRSGHLLGFG